MSSGVYVSVINEVANRLNKVTGAYVQLGYKADRLAQDQERYFLIDLTSISEEYGQAMQNRRKDGMVSLVVRCMKATRSDEQNKLYDATWLVDGDGNYVIDAEGNKIVSGATGLVPFIEEVLDALNTDGTTLNPQMVNSANSIGVSVDGFEWEDTRVWFNVNLEIKTRPFVINNRQQI